MLRSENDIELHVMEAEKRGIRIEIENSGYILAGFDHFKSEILGRIKSGNYKNIIDIVFRVEITFDEIIDVLDTKYFNASSTGYTLPPGKYKFIDPKSMFNTLLPVDIKVDITIDDTRQRSNLNTEKKQKIPLKNLFSIQY